MLANEKLIATKIKCDNFKSRYCDMAGECEKRLSDALESKNVVLQAYHRNVMVGNHCVIVLKNDLTLTEIIAHREDISKELSKSKYNKKDT